MHIKLTKTESGTLSNAIEYFEIFSLAELPEDEEEWSEEEKAIDNTDFELQRIYDELFETNIIDVSLSDIHNCVIALNIYSEIISKDIPTRKGLLTEPQKDLALRNIFALKNLFFSKMAELNDNEAFPTFELDPSSNYL